MSSFIICLNKLSHHCTQYKNITPWMEGWKNYSILLKHFGVEGHKNRRNLFVWCGGHQGGLRASKTSPSEEIKLASAQSSISSGKPPSLGIKAYPIRYVLNFLTLEKSERSPLFKKLFILLKRRFKREAFIKVSHKLTSLLPPLIGATFYKSSHRIKSFSRAHNNNNNKHLSRTY